MHSTIIKHINRGVCGEAIEGAFAGFHRRLGQEAPEGGFARGISIGCGNGIKEMNLIRQGIVKKFDLYDLSEVRVKQGRLRAEELGISDNIHFHCQDGLETIENEKYDIVYWNNSLHHMLDVDEAILKSKQMLIAGGLFAMDDYIGPSRFQWTDSNLLYANKVRDILEDRHYVSQNKALINKITPEVLRPTIESMIQIDPTEAADSSNIIPSLEYHFDNAEVKYTGGCIYHLALNDVLENFVEEDQTLLQSLLLLDDALADNGESHYAVAYARNVTC